MLVARPAGGDGRCARRRDQCCGHLRVVSGARSRYMFWVERACRERRRFCSSVGVRNCLRTVACVCGRMRRQGDRGFKYVGRRYVFFCVPQDLIRAIRSMYRLIGWRDCRGAPTRGGHPLKGLFRPGDRGQERFRGR